MKTNKERQSVSNPEKINENDGKIELVSCPRNETICKDHLFLINKCYEEAGQHRQEKNFQLSIESLKIAFNKTTELNQQHCVRCAELFRSTIAESLDDIRDELEKMTTGFFGNKRYKSSLLIAEKTLTDFENAKPFNTIQLDAPEKTLPDNDIQKEVI